jgi:hypothetical protein
MKYLFDLLRRLARCTSGTATLEATIVLPVAISLMTGGIEFGNFYSTYGTAAKSVRDAARYLARVPTRDALGNLTGAICAGGWGLTNATNLAIYGNLSGTGTPLIPTTTTITTPGIGDCNNPTDITLQANVPYTPLMFSGIPYTNIQFSARTLTLTHLETWIGE